MVFLRHMLMASIVLIIVIMPFTTFQVSSARFTLFKAKSEIEIVAERDYLPGLPLNEEVNTSLIVVYSFSRFSIPSGYFLLSPSPTRINLEVIKKPEWCEVTLEKNNLSANLPFSCIISGGNITFEVGVSIKVISKDAPGYKEEKIVIRAVASENGNIQASNDSCTIRVEPGFYPGIKINQSAFFLELTQGESGEVELWIKNCGNMEIVANIDIENDTLPDIVSIDLGRAKNISIKPGDVKVAYVEVSAKNIKRKSSEIFSLPLRISYYAKGHKELKGSDAYINIDVKIEGGEIPPPVNSAVVGIIILVLVIIGGIIVLMKKRI